MLLQAPALYSSASCLWEDNGPVIPTAMSQCPWQYISHCKFSFLCNCISREFYYYGPPLLLPGDASPLHLLHKSSFQDERRVSCPEPGRIHQSKCHLVCLMTPLISQHALFHTFTVTWDYHKYFTQFFHTPNLGLWLKLADSYSILIQEQSFPKCIWLLICTGPSQPENQIHCSSHSPCSIPLQRNHLQAIEISAKILWGEAGASMCKMHRKTPHIYWTHSLCLQPSHVHIPCCAQGGPDTYFLMGYSLTVLCLLKAIGPDRCPLGWCHTPRKVGTALYSPCVSLYSPCVSLKTH